MSEQINRDGGERECEMQEPGVDLGSPEVDLENSEDDREEGRVNLENPEVDRQYLEHYDGFPKRYDQNPEVDG